MEFKGWLRFILLGLIWGGAFAWIKIGVREVPPLTLVLLRSSIAAAALGGYLAVKKIPLPVRKYALVFLVLGFLNIALPFSLVAWAEKHIPSGMASVLNATTPLWTIFIAPLFIRAERITPLRVFGLLLGFAGVVMLLSNRLNNSGGDYRLGVAAMLTATLAYAVAAVIARRHTAGLQPEAQAVGQTLGAAVLLLPAAAWYDAPLRLPQQPLTWAALLYLGLLATSLAVTLYFALIHSAGPTQTTMVAYLVALVGVTLGTLLLDEPFNLNMLLGTLMIIGGITLVNQHSAVFWRKHGTKST